MGSWSLPSHCFCISAPGVGMCHLTCSHGFTTLSALNKWFIMPCSVPEQAVMGSIGGTLCSCVRTLPAHPLSSRDLSVAAFQEGSGFSSEDDELIQKGVTVSLPFGSACLGPWLNSPHWGPYFRLASPSSGIMFWGHVEGVAFTQNSHTESLVLYRHFSSTNLISL